jgi:hypothetical protein
MPARNHHRSPVVSRAWRDQVFESSERIDVEKTAKSTTRHPVSVSWRSGYTYANGGHERTAALILDQLWYEGYVRRWKAQPVNFQEFGGPDAVPDFLAELSDDSLHFIQVKAKRFLSEEVEAAFALQRSFLESAGFGLHVWTNQDVLSSATSHTVNELERGRRYPAGQDVVEQIRLSAANCSTVGELLRDYGWDDTLSAAAQLAFHIDFTSPIHEHTPILRDRPPSHYGRLFARRNASREWWDTLRPSKA